MFNRVKTKPAVEKNKPLLGIKMSAACLPNFNPFSFLKRHFINFKHKGQFAPLPVKALSSLGENKPGDVVVMLSG